MYASVSEAWPTDPACRLYNQAYQETMGMNLEYAKNESESRDRPKETRQMIIEKGENVLKGGTPCSTSQDDIDASFDKYMRKYADYIEDDGSQYMNFLLYVVTGAFIIILMDLFLRIGKKI